MSDTAAHWNLLEHDTELPGGFRIQVPVIRRELVSFTGEGKEISAVGLCSSRTADASEPWTFEPVIETRGIKPRL
jgi:hypothetical protein